MPTDQDREAKWNQFRSYFAKREDPEITALRARLEEQARVAVAAYKADMDEFNKTHPKVGVANAAAVHNSAGKQVPKHKDNVRMD